MTDEPEPAAWLNVSTNEDGKDVYKKVSFMKLDKLSGPQDYDSYRAEPLYTADQLRDLLDDVFDEREEELRERIEDEEQPRQNRDRARVRGQEKGVLEERLRQRLPGGGESE